MKILMFVSMILMLTIGSIIFAVDVRRFLDKVVFVNTWEGIGSGVVIGTNYVLTCFHLDHEFFVQGLPAKIVKNDSRVDLVYLKTIQKYENFAQLTKIAVLGEKVYVVGYAEGRKTFLTGYIARIENGYILIDTKVIQGLSGGGVFNENGELVGIVCAGIGYPDKLLMAVDFTTIKKFLNPEKEDKDEDWLLDE